MIQSMSSVLGTRRLSSEVPRPAVICLRQDGGRAQRLPLGFTMIRLWTARVRLACNLSSPNRCGGRRSIR